MLVIAAIEITAIKNAYSTIVAPVVLRNKKKIGRSLNNISSIIFFNFDTSIGLKNLTLGGELQRVYQC
jgi:hypothetical protein